MTKEDRLDWFPCEPSRLLGALAGMKSPKKLVYLIVLLRIYECGGSCADTIDALALRVGHNKRVVTDALSELCKENKLYFGEGGIRNWKADDVIADSFALRERRKGAAVDAANSRWEKTKRNQQKVDAGRNADAVPFDAHLHLQEQDSLFSNENRVPAPKPKPDRKPIALKPVAVVEPVPDDGWPKDHLDQFWQAFPPFRREAKRKVGEKLAKIRAAKTIAWDALLGAVGRYAASNPGEFACAPIVWLNNERWDREYGSPANGGARHGENRNSREPKLGYAGIAAKLRSRASERPSDSTFFADAADPQPDDGRRFASTAMGSMDRAGEAPPFAPIDPRR